MIKQIVAIAVLALASQAGANELSHILLKAGAAMLDEARVPKHRYSGTSDTEIDPAKLRLPPAAGNFEQCREQFTNGRAPELPASMRSGTRALCFNGFAVLYSGKSKTPLFSAEVLNRKRVAEAKGEQRTNQFFEDARLPSAERALLDDYRGSGFDRGHMSPAGDMAGPESMAQSFSLANMIPQSRLNNQYAWADIEKATRKYASRATGDVYVITGPVFDPQGCPFVLAAERELQNKGFSVPATRSAIVKEAASKAGYRPPYRYDAEACTIGASRVHVPSHIYKLVHDEASGRSWAHWIENTDWAQVSKPISYEQLVSLTGINFIPGK